MHPDRTQKKLALLAGGELQGFSRRRLESRLQREPELQMELEGFRDLKGLYGRLAQDTVPASISNEARARLRMRVRARVRAEALASAPARSGFRPSLVGSLAAAGIIGMVLAVLMSGYGPADRTMEVPGMQASVPTTPGLQVFHYEVQEVLVKGASGPVLRWSNGDEQSRYVVLRSTRPGQEKALAVVRGHEWTDEQAPRSGLLSYRIVRLPERS